MNALYAGWHRHKLGVMVFRRDAASVVSTVRDEEAEVSGSLSTRFDNPAELRDFALKCLAAAEVMEGAEE